MAVEFRSRGWTHTDDGWVYEVRAVSPSGRIVARARANLAYDDANNIQHYLGAEAIQEIERSTRETCEQLVPASER